MRIQKTDTRERKWNNLKEATDESTVSGALDTAADFYLRMVGDTAAIPKGQFEELLDIARDQGSVTPEEIADILDSDELPVEVEVSRKVGPE